MQLPVAMRSVPQRFTVVGGGLGGIVAAHLLAQRGHAVTLVERAPFLGGVLHGTRWKDRPLDFGCHLFSNDTDETTELFLHLMDGEAEPVALRTASVTNGVVTRGIELPDLRAFGADTSRNILFEVAEAAANATNQPAPTSLRALTNARYGDTASTLLADCLRKMFVAEPDELAPLAAHAAPVGRIVCAPDPVAEVLKQSPALDDRLAVASQDDPMRFLRQRVRNYPARAFYPRHGGTRGFVDRAERHLRDAGVRVLTATAIESLTEGANATTVKLADGEDLRCDGVVWTAGLPALDAVLGTGVGVAEHVHRVPMVLYYFEVERDRVAPLCYVHDFDPNDLVFRASAAANYGGPVVNGRAIVCAEVTTALNSDIFESPDRSIERVWSDLARRGFVTGDAALDVHITKTPVSYQLPRRGYGAAAAELRARIATNSRLRAADDFLFSKVKVAQNVAQLVDQILEPTDQNRRAA